MGIFKDFIDYFTKLFTWWVVVMPWEQGVRVTWGSKSRVIEAGVWLKLPLVHVVYVMEKRTRVVTMAPQTISTLDGQALTLSCSVSYEIIDIEKLFNSLYQPDLSIQNIIQSEVANYVSKNVMSDIRPDKIEASVKLQDQGMNWGLKIHSVRVLNFANVKTYRLIQDSQSIWEGLDLREFNKK